MSTSNMNDQNKKEAVDGEIIETAQSTASKQIIPQNISTRPVLEGDPERVLEFARKAALALTTIVKNKAKKVIINGEQYLEFEDWQTIARFYGTTAGIEWTKSIIIDGKLNGYEAKALAYNKQGQVISSAEASCMRDEPNWKSKPEFQLKSMAQTRAMAKTLRNVFAWVVVLAGYRPTPAEEIADLSTTKEPPFESPQSYIPAEEMICSECNVDLQKYVRVVKYSKERYGKVLCMNCQRKPR